MLAFAFPSIDPILFEIGPVAVRWYSLAYIAGILLGWRYMVWMASQTPQSATRDDVDDFLVWAIFAVILGGRVGYVLFYNFGYYSANPSQIFMVWQGGMSFHGGLLGVTIAAMWFCKRRKIEILRFFDMVCVAAPIGLLFGRIANFINAELYGRPTEVAWGVIFPGAGNIPRHPSQLYEAALEGLVLLIILFILFRIDLIRKQAGLLSGIFLIGYGIARSIAELFREPDAHLGFLLGGSTMGQWLSAPMWIIGFWLIFRAIKLNKNQKKI